MTDMYEKLEHEIKKLDPSKDIILRLNTLKPGERMIFHEGFLSYECDLEDPGKNGKKGPLSKVREAIWKLYERGFIEIVQRKKSPSNCKKDTLLDCKRRSRFDRVYEYIAIMRRCRATYPRYWHEKLSPLKGGN